MNSAYALGGARLAARRLFGSELLRAAAHFTEGEKVLDIGVGSDRMLRLLKERGGMKLYGASLGEAAGQITRVRITDLPFADGFFDSVVTVETAALWEDVAGGLGEIKRVLREGGLLVCAIGKEPDPRELRRRARAAGFGEVRAKVIEPERSYILLCRK